MHNIEQLFESPITAIVVAVVLGALALSGRFSVTATQIMLIGAWIVAIFGMRLQPLPIICGMGAILGGMLILLAYYFRPETVPSYSGTLTARSPVSLRFSPEGGGTGTTPKIQIGQSGVFFIGPEGAVGATLFPALRDTEFKVEAIDGKIKVSTRIVDGSGNLIAEIIRNEWKVAPAQAWDRNYSDDALEVKDSRGLVILQVRALPDRIQIQGGWWVDMGPPNGIRRLWVASDPEKQGAKFIIAPKEDESPVMIAPMFEYPSEKHLGEMKQK